jgi:alginate O-acetyltransferase complex protein AlgI
MLAVNHAWRALPLSRSLVLKTGLAERIAVFMTFTAVTLAWVLFRSETLADAKTMFATLWPMTADPSGWPSFWGLLRRQFTDLRYALALTEWFRPRELWPAVLPPDYLATATRPMGLLLVCVGLATFTLPNTYQIFGRFKPALGLPEDTVASGILRRLDWRVAIIVAGMFLLSVLRLSHVSPFLYYQF